MKKLFFVLFFLLLSALPVTVWANEDCDSLQLPYYEDFQDVYVPYSYTYTSLDTCWFVAWAGPSNSAPKVYKNGDDKYLRASMSYYNGGFFATPPIAEVTDSLYVRFRARYEGPCMLLYGIMNAADTTTFVFYDTLPLEAAADWTTVEFSTVGMPVSGNLRFAVKAYGYGSSTLYVDDIFIDHGAECMPPHNLHVGYIDSTSVTLEWECSDSPSHFVVTLDDTIVLNCPTGAIDINDLLPDHEYNYTVRAICSDGDSTSAIAGRFRTMCVGVTLPYMENFVTVPVNTLPDCWRTLYCEYNLGDNTYPSVRRQIHSSWVDSVLVYDTSYFIQFIGNSMVITPMIMTPANHIHVSFTILPSNNGVLDAGILLDPTDISSFVLVDSWQTVEAVSNMSCEFYTEDYSDSGYVYVAFRWRQMGSVMSSCYMYDVNIEELQPCHAPTHTYIDDVAPNSLNLHWVDHSGTAYGYEVRYGDTNDVESFDTSIFTQDTFYFVDNLQYNTYYYFWVRSLCPYDSLRWIPFEGIRTSCGVATLPYEEKYETYENGDVLPCWTYLHTYDNNIIDPYVTVDAISAHEGNAMVFESNLYDTLTVLLPQFGTRGDELEVSFWFHAVANGGAVAWLQAGLMNMVTHDFVPAITLTGATGNGNSPLQFVFASDTLGISDSVRVAFRWYASGSSFCRGTLDDVKVRFIPLCRAPDSLTFDGITDTSAVVHIHDHWHVGYYRIIYESDNSSDTVYTYSADQTITGLHHSSWYQVSVNSICYDGETTDTVTSIFSTQCLVIAHDSLPYFENFNNYTTEGDRRISPCWNVINNNPYILDYPRTFDDDGNVDMMFAVRGNCPQYLVLPEVDYLDDIYVGFSAKTNEQYNVTTIDVGVMTNPNDATTFVTVATVSPAYANVWEAFNVQFYSYQGTGRYVAFRVNTQVSAIATNKFAWIDNVSIRIVPQCSDSVRYLSTHDVGATCATIDWKTSMGINFGAYYLIHVSDTSGHVLQVDTTEDLSYTICNLAPQTSFRAYVELVCGGSVVATSQEVGFTTQCEEYFLLNLTHGTYTGMTNAYLPMSCHLTHSESQQLYFSQELQNMAGTITDISFKFTSNGNMSFVDNAECSIYIGHTYDSVMTHMHPVSGMTLVYSGPLNLRPGWINLSLERPFHYDGVHNIVIAMVTDCERPMVSTSGFFTAMANNFNTSEPVSMYLNANDSIVGSNYRNSIRIHTCPDVQLYCVPPTIDSVSATDHSITVNFSTDAPCDVHITRGWWNRGFNGIMLDTTSYTFENLHHSTVYTIGVRKHCAEEDLSRWTLLRVSTLYIDAIPPSTLNVSNISFGSADATWNRVSDEHFWQLHVFNGVMDTILTVTDTFCSINDLRSNVIYNVSVRSVYGTFNDVFSPWGDTVTFTTDYCREVSNIVISDVTMTSARVSWTPGENGNAWNIVYGYMGFGNGEAIGNILVEGATSTVITDLMPETGYNLYIATICDSVHRSIWATTDTFYTPDEFGSIDYADVNQAFILYPNPASATVTLSSVESYLPARIEMVDINGRMVLRETLKSPSVALRLDNLAHGIYFVRFTGDGQTSVRKLIVE